MKRLVRAVMAVFLLVGALVWAAPPAHACACGGVFTTEGVTVNTETGLVWFDGHTETIDMQLLLNGSAASAAWVMPAPPGAELSLGSADAINAARVASLPEHVTKNRVQLTTLFAMLGASGSSGSGAGAAAAPGVFVDSVTQVGPFTVTTLSGSKGSEVAAWLTAHGYPGRADLDGAFQTYLDQGWRINAVKITPGTGAPQLGAALPPLRLSFSASKIVYPLRLSHHASLTQNVTIYVAAPHKMAIAQQPAPNQPMTLTFAGTVPGSGLGRPEQTTFLTTYRASLAPVDIVNDVTFAQASDDTPFREVVTDWHDIDVPVDLIAVAVLAVGIIGGHLLRRRRAS